MSPEGNPGYPDPVDWTEDPDLSGTGFTEVSGEVKRRIVMDVSGMEGSGKSHFALTAPDPIGYLDFDVGSEGVVEKFKKGLDGLPKKRIYASKYRIPLTAKAAKKASKDVKERLTKEAADLAEPIWDKVVNDYVKGLERFRTMIVDTGTEMHEMIRLARLGKLTEVLPEHYGPVNAEFRDLVRLAFDSDCNVIFLHKMKDEWVKTKGSNRSHNTGKKIRQGFNGMGYLMQVNLEMNWDKDVAKEAEDFEEAFSIEVVKCRHNAKMRGEVIEHPLNSFPFVAQMVMPESDVGDWE